MGKLKNLKNLKSEHRSNQTGAPAFKRGISWCKSDGKTRAPAWGNCAFHGVKVAATPPRAYYYYYYYHVTPLAGVETNELLVYAWAGCAGCLVHEVACLPVLLLSDGTF